MAQPSASTVIADPQMVQLTATATQQSGQIANIQQNLTQAQSQVTYWTNNLASTQAAYNSTLAAIQARLVQLGLGS